MTVTLTPDEARVLGVLTEKAQTTPGQYPMSLNGVTIGCNQKSNRHPVLNMSEERVFDALDTLRLKKFVRQVDLSGSRVEKFRHIARDILDVTTHQLVVLAELMLRGPQTIGDIRSRATRMHPIESLDIAQNIVNSLIDRDPPLIRKRPPPPGSRAELYEQLLCPDLHPIEATPVASPVDQSSPRGFTSNALEQRISTLEQRVESLAGEVEALRARL